MKRRINPEETTRAQAYKLWMASPMPMVTITKTFDISPLVRYGKRHRKKLNMLLCHCIGMAAQQEQAFFLLPEKDGLYQYDSLALNVIVENRQGGINSCDIPYSDHLEQFNNDYLRLTRQAVAKCKSSFLEEQMIIGTSALVQTELDSITNQYTELFKNPFLSWGRYRKHWFRYTLPISFQFHHVQMDGMQAAKFLEQLQNTIVDYRWVSDEGVSWKL